VFSFFYEVLQCSQDVSYRLTALLTYQNHVPTGSPVSQLIAFYSHYNMFNTIYDLAKNKNLQMTCYVDDITLSGNKANKQTLYQVRRIIMRRSLLSAKEKERIYNVGKARLVTGIIINKQQLKLPNKKHKLIHDTNSEILKDYDENDRLILIKSNIGRINAANAIEKNSSNSILNWLHIKKQNIKQDYQ
jgi:hypothetical protein